MVIRVLQPILAIAFLLNCAGAFAADTSELLATLSEAKARAEGRARLIQSCGFIGSKVPAAVLAKYEDARASFNSRIDALALDIKSKKLKDFSANEELPRLNEALNRVDQFVRTSDEFLARRNCSVLKKANWGKVVALVLTPEMLKVVLDFFHEIGASDADRDEYLKRCEAQRILEWSKVRVIVVFDWKNSSFYTAEGITPEILSRGSTSIYVNEWALPSRIGKSMAYGKELPLGLSDSYKLYTGDMSKLKGFSEPM